MQSIVFQRVVILTLLWRLLIVLKAAKWLLIRFVFALHSLCAFPVRHLQTVGRRRCHQLTGTFELGLSLGIIIPLFIECFLQPPIFLSKLFLIASKNLYKDQYKFIGAMHRVCSSNFLTCVCVADLRTRKNSPKAMPIWPKASKYKQ